MYIDQGEVVRVRVEADDFFDDEPGPPKAAEGVQVKREAKRAPYHVIVSRGRFLLFFFFPSMRRVERGYVGD